MPQDTAIKVVDRRKQGYFTVDNIILDAYGSILKAHGIAVYNALARFANGDQESWPGRRKIEALTGVSLAQINRELNKMVDLQLITITPQYNERGDQTSNLYTLLEPLAAPPSLPDTPPLSRREPPLITQRTKQSKKKKDIHPPKKKERSGTYRPHADIDPLSR